MKKISLLSIIIVLFASCGSKQEKLNPTVEKITESVYASGIIKSKNQYQVFATVNGLIEEIFIKEGGLVKTGDSILRIQNLSSELNAANAKLAADLASFNTNGDRLNELKTNIDFAKTKLKNDSILFERQKNLWAQQIGTKNEFEQRELAYKNSLANYKTAILRYNDSKKQLDFSAQQAKNNLSISNSIKSDFIVRSETNGRLYSLLKEKGEMLTPQTPIAVIGDENNFILELQVDEYDITKIKLGQKIIVSLDSYKGQTFEAEVTKINTIMNERTRSFLIMAEFSIKPPVIYPNLSVEANIVIQSKDNALTIPRNYLVNDSFVLNEKNEKIKIAIGLMDYKKVEVLNGISSSDFILKPEK
ncbi:MAG: efflux RND transporter periplasmic adaptor subunit [Bacteroidota bacterium]|nr:efflux RND transporter periplasmic adaptor subunit [Bacteroidota bacterium]MDP3143806.1 efflux RND transporter periplasmic adaptor subunit [Bacteroidota bacterium]